MKDLSEFFHGIVDFKCVFLIFLITFLANVFQITFES